MATKAKNAQSWDLVAIGENSLDELWYLQRLPPTGAKAEARSRRQLPGGQVATTALMARRLGLEVCYGGAIGSDDRAEHGVELLQQERVELCLRRVKGIASRSALVLVDEAGERTIIEHRDPKLVLREEDLPKHALSHCRALHLDFSSPTAALAAAEHARESGALISVDLDRIEADAEQLLPMVDLLVVSQGACEERALSPQQMLSFLAERCSGLICVTLGHRGALALVQGSVTTVEPFEVQVVDTTACGDVFRAALLTALLQGQASQDALVFAAAAGALQATSWGAQHALPSRDAIERLVASRRS